MDCTLAVNRSIQKAEEQREHQEIKRRTLEAYDETQNEEMVEGNGRPLFLLKGVSLSHDKSTELFGGIPVVHVQKGARLSQKARKQQEQRPAPVGKPAGRAASSPAQHPQQPQQYQPFYPQNYQQPQQQQQPPQNAGGRGDGFSGGYFVEPRRKR